MEQKTPARGHTFGINTLGFGPLAARSTSQRISSESITAARDLAQATASIIPEGFDRVFPRGYSISGSSLLMARFEMIEMRGHALYARHPSWGDKEARVFLRDLREGWLDELSTFMRWQLRADPIANAIFQHAWVHLKAEATRRLLVT